MSVDSWRSLLGRRRRNDRLSEEALKALVLLFEQVAATLHNRAVEQQRSVAERRLIQQEKLSVLGLIAGSLAHELRNPLSSIRTIATLLKEELPADDPKHRDVASIVSEFERLTQTTQRLLNYAKPADHSRLTSEPDRVVARLLPILEQLARQYHVQLTADLQAPQCSVVVQTRISDNRLELKVRDNGPGIDSSVRDSLFQPFVTCKIEGTGLGLYVVAERVRELDGKLTCQSSTDGGTEFVVQLTVSEAAT